jgi:hypothetical protein
MSVFQGLARLGVAGVLSTRVTYFCFLLEGAGRLRSLHDFIDFASSPFLGRSPGAYTARRRQDSDVRVLKHI